MICPDVQFFPVREKIARLHVRPAGSQRLALSRHVGLGFSHERRVVTRSGYAGVGAVAVECGDRMRRHLRLHRLADRVFGYHIAIALGFMAAAGFLHRGVRLRHQVRLGWSIDAEARNVGRRSRLSGVDLPQAWLASRHFISERDGVRDKERHGEKEHCTDHEDSPNSAIFDSKASGGRDAINYVRQMPRIALLVPDATFHGYARGE
jgi:hypothetical protein